MTNQTSELDNKKTRQLFAKKKKEMKELKDIFHWVEETTVKLELQILTEERLKQMGDVQYKNKWKRYVLHKELTDSIIRELLDVSEDMHILDKLTEFWRFMDGY